MTSHLPKLGELGLKAMVVDLDGVITDTASVHAHAWKELFDEYLRTLESRDGKAFVPFDLEADYITYVDGKPRYDGVQSFLLSRDIDLSWGTDKDSPTEETVCGLGNRKNIMFNKIIHQEGAVVFDTTVDLLEHMRAKGLKTAVVSSSKNCELILESTELQYLFDAMVDGTYAADHGLPGKPSPDTFVRGCELIGVRPEDSAAVEDAVVGVQACRAGNFKLVIGVDRGVGKDALLEGGADVVVHDLGEFELD